MTLGEYPPVDRATPRDMPRITLPRDALRRSDIHLLLQLLEDRWATLDTERRESESIGYRFTLLKEQEALERLQQKLRVML